MYIFSLQVEKFSNKEVVSKKDKNIADKLDYRVKLRIGHLQLAYISKFFWEITVIKIMKRNFKHQFHQYQHNK